MIDGTRIDEPAHGRRALLFDDVALRAVGADRLALALPHRSQRIMRGPDHEGDEQRRQRPRRAVRKVR